jgi:hypothetical protein
MTRVVRLLLLPCLLPLGCGISASDPLPGIGAPCNVASGQCPVEHACRPDAPGAEEGLCAPLPSFGSCDDDEPVTHAPGREGEDLERDEVLVRDAESMIALEDVRAVSGRVRVFQEGAERVAIESFCGLRDLQRVGAGLVLADTTGIASLDGLQSLTSVGGGLLLLDNNGLTSLDALAQLVDVGSRTVTLADDSQRTVDVVIAGNDELGDDVVAGFVAALEARVGRALTVVACSNDGAVCADDDVALVQQLVTTGGGGD